MSGILELVPGRPRTSRARRMAEQAQRLLASLTEGERACLLGLLVARDYPLVKDFCEDRGLMRRTFRSLRWEAPE